MKNKKEYYSIGQAAEFLGLSIFSLRNYHRDGNLIPDYITPGGSRRYSKHQLEAFSNSSKKSNRKTIAYARVSSKKQESDLKRQVENLETYMVAKGYKFELITDIGSGINYSKKGFVKLLEKIENNEVDKVVVLYKDRLLRFGYDLFEKICQLHDTSIEIVSDAGEIPEEELVNDLIQVVTVFSCRLQGRRSKKTKELLKELTNED